MFLLSSWGSDRGCMKSSREAMEEALDLGGAILVG